MYKIEVKIKGCKNFEELADFIRSKNIRLILFAETHGFLNEIPIQKKIIQSANPDFFLYEMLEESKILNIEDAQRFLSKPDNKDFSVISTYKELKPTIRLAKSFNLPIIGCDIKNMCQKDKSWLKKKFSREEAKALIKKRELRQSKIINQYTSKGMVFASLGAYHLRRGSITISSLKEKNFIMVSPSFKGKEVFLIRANQKELADSYSVKLKKKK